MQDLTTLELRLRRKDATRFAIEMVVSQPKSETPVYPLGQKFATAKFDIAKLLELWPDTDAYGRALGEMLFGEEKTATAFAMCRAATQSSNQPLRLLLDIAPDATELHTIYWETLRDPQSGAALALSDQIRLVRALSSDSWRPVTLRAHSQLRALVVIAAPPGLERFGLAPINVAVEQQVAFAGLGRVPTTVLAPPAAVSLPLIIEQLRKGVDILYLVAHGALDDEEPVLFLDDGQGQVTRIPGNELVERIANLMALPRLVMLASCQSAGLLSSNALTAVGPRLAAAGVPAVIAAQGPLSMQSNQIFAPVFFKELNDHGQIDQAIAVARQAIAKQPDWWAPALFTRLRSGRIWYKPGFDGQELSQEFSKWPAVVRSIVSDPPRCTPILGPGLLEQFIGTSRDLAHRLVQKHRFPLTPSARDDLPQVAQYLANDQDTFYLHDVLSEAFREALAAHTADGSLPPGQLDEQLAAIGAQRRAADPTDPYRVLAQLPLPIFLTTNPDRLLIDALREAGKDPQVLMCPWDRDSETESRPFVLPTVERPLVFYFFGRLDHPASLVLTEDDYFRYLMGVTRNDELLPTLVNKALTSSALLFLGFRLEDWNFRVLYQGFTSLEGYQRSMRYTRVAVQVDPQEGVMLDPQAAREYLRNYFGQKAQINIYWGSADDFLRELARQMP